jgi:hypothetical protein
MAHVTTSSHRTTTTSSRPKLEAVGDARKSSHFGFWIFILHRCLLNVDLEKLVRVFARFLSFTLSLRDRVVHWWWNGKSFSILGCELLRRGCLVLLLVRWRRTRRRLDI